MDSLGGGEGVEEREGKREGGGGTEGEREGGRGREGEGGEGGGGRGREGEREERRRVGFTKSHLLIYHNFHTDTIFVNPLTPISD